MSSTEIPLSMGGGRKEGGACRSLSVISHVEVSTGWGGEREMEEKNRGTFSFRDLHSTSIENKLEGGKANKFVIFTLKFAHLPKENHKQPRTSTESAPQIIRYSFPQPQHRLKKSPIVIPPSVRFPQKEKKLSRSRADFFLFSIDAEHNPPFNEEGKKRIAASV